MQRESTKLQNRKLLRIGVPNTPKICSSTGYRPLFNFNSILSEYSKLVHLSPLAFIILSLEKFLFNIALLLGPWCLNDDMEGLPNE